MVFLYNENPWNCCDHLVSGPTALGLWSIYHHVGDAQAVQVQLILHLKNGGCNDMNLLRQPGEEVPDMTSPDFPEYGSRRCPGEYRWVLGGWLNPARIFYRRCWHPKKVPRYCKAAFKDELINSGNQLKQFPGNPSIFIAFLSLEKPWRAGRVGLRSTSGKWTTWWRILVQAGVLGVWNRRCVFFAFFCFGEDLHIPLAFGAIAGFWTCFLAVYLNVVFWASECPVARFFLFFLPSPYLQSLRFQDGLRTFHGCYILFGSVSVFPPFPATEDELETQRQAGSCYKCTILTFLDFWSAEAAEDQSTSCWLYILCPSFSAFFRGTD